MPSKVLSEGAMLSIFNILTMIFTYATNGNNISSFFLLHIKEKKAEYNSALLEFYHNKTRNKKLKTKNLSPSKLI